MNSLGSRKSDAIFVMCLFGAIIVAMLGAWLLACSSIIPEEKCAIRENDSTASCQLKVEDKK